MSRIKTIFLDLDDTLYAYDECHKFGLNSIFQSLKNRGYENDFNKFTQNYKQAQKTVKLNTVNQAACHNRMLYLQHYLEIKNRWSPEYTLELYNTYWDNFLKKMKLNPFVLEFLNKAKSLDIKVCIVTDLTAHIQHRKIIQLGISNFITSIVSSEEAGCEKPTKRIYEIALNKMGCIAEEAIFVGDSLEKDVEGPGNMGIKSFHFNNKELFGELLNEL